MNNDKHKLDLEGLLAEVEHAGRDARRQDELAAMVDSMAGANRHGFWWWGARVAAAACVLFFIGTAVRIWFIPTDNTVDDNLVAQAEVPEVIPVAADTVAVAPAVTPAESQPVRKQRHVVSTEVVEEYVAEEVQAEPESEKAPVVEERDTVIIIEEAVVPEPAPIVQAEPVDAVATPIVSVSNTSEQPVATADERKSKRASIFKNIFRRHEPSKMDGTML